MMHRTIGVCFLLILGFGCLDSKPYGPTGYHCDSDADCDAPGYCFRQRCALASEVPVKPGPANTGVPPDLTLSFQGGLDITEEGAVVEGLDIQGCVKIFASRVTIRNSKIRCSSYYVFQLEPGVSQLLVEDTEIDGGGFTEGIAFSVDNAVGRRLNIHNVGRGASLGDNTRLENSYIHSLTGQQNGVVSYGGQGIVIFGNTIEGKPGGPGAAINLQGALGPVADAVVERNWLSGGRATLIMGGGNKGTTNAAAHHNRFARDFGASPFELSAGAVQYENVWDDTGETLSD